MISRVLVLSVGILGGAAAASGYPGDFFVGVDSRELVSTVPSNIYYNLPNPNKDRLTFLFAHWNDSTPSSNHYHGIGAYSLIGTPPGHSVLNTNSNNTIPEIYTGQGPLKLRPGTGLYAGKRTTGFLASEDYSNLNVQSTAVLGAYAPGTPEQIMFNSSGNRWSQSLAGSVVALELIALSPGLNVGDASTMNLLVNPGDQIVLGPGDNFSFTPVLWIDDEPNAPMRQASFKLVDVRDTGTPFGESGVFHIQVIPEPAALTLLPLAGLGLLRRRRVAAQV